MDVDINNYKIGNTILGRGTFSTVFYGSCITTGEHVAIKKIIFIEQKNLDHVALEIDTMQKMNYVHIVKYHTVIRKPDHLYIVMEYCNYGTLDDVIAYNKKKLEEDSFENQSNIFIDLERNTLYYLYQLKNALNYINNLGYVHRDIKSQNVLLVHTGEENPMLDFSSENTESNLDLLFGGKGVYKKEKNYHINQNIIVKLADFGLAKYVSETNEIDLMSKTVCGTPNYMAPELLIKGEYNSKVDLWAFGVIMYRMLFHTYPIQASSIPQLKVKMREVNINFNVSNNFTPKCFDLLIKLLDKNHKLRISWEYFFNHEWFSNSAITETFNHISSQKTQLPHEIKPRNTKALFFGRSSNKTTPCGGPSGKTTPCGGPSGKTTPYGGPSGKIESKNINSLPINNENPPLRNNQLIQNKSIAQSSNLSKMKMNKYDTTKPITYTYGDVHFAKKIRSDSDIIQSNTIGFSSNEYNNISKSTPCLRTDTKEIGPNIIKSNSLPLKISTDHDMTDSNSNSLLLKTSSDRTMTDSNSNSLPLKISTSHFMADSNSDSNSDGKMCPRLNKTGIIRSNFSPMSIIENYDNMSAEKSSTNVSPIQSGSTSITSLQKYAKNL